MLKSINFLMIVLVPCSKLAAQFQSMEVRNSNFAAFIDIFTSNTYVMVIMSDPAIRKYPTLILIVIQISFCSSQFVSKFSVVFSLCCHTHQYSKCKETF